MCQSSCQQLEFSTGSFSQLKNYPAIFTGYISAVKVLQTSYIRIEIVVIQHNTVQLHFRHFSGGVSMKYRKVMLINPSNAIPKDSVRRLTVPLGILYIAACLEDKYCVSILDSTCEGYYNTKIQGDELIYGLTDNQVKKRIKDFDPDIVGVSCMFSSSYERAQHHCQLVKEVKDVPVVLGGIHPSLFPEESILHDAVDFVIAGEGEIRFRKLLDMLNEGKEDFHFDGIAYKKKGKVIHNVRTTAIEDLDALPFPARNLIDYERYMKIGVPYAPFSRGKRVCQILTSRGCPFNCFFCSTVKFWGRQFRMRSVDNIIAEIKYMIDEYNVDEVQFPDDNLTLHRNRTKELFTRYKDEIGLPWCTPTGLMVKTLDKPLAKLMAESGAYQVTFAIESGSERVLKEVIHKPVPPKKKIKELVDEFHQNDVQVHGLFIVGFPGETKEEMMQTLTYPFDIGFESVTFFIANPMPGSALHRFCSERGYLPEHTKLNFKTSEIVIPGDSPDFVMTNEELEALVDEKTREYNEFSRNKFPDKWETKYKQFLERHGEDADLILGRVT